LDYVAKGKVKVMTETFSLKEAADAYEKMASERVRFPAVVSAYGISTIAKYMPGREQGIKERLA
jgi:hypothetical protein